jgi:hypothetical protein
MVECKKEEAPLGTENGRSNSLVHQNIQLRLLQVIRNFFGDPSEAHDLALQVVLKPDDKNIDALVGCLDDMPQGDERDKANRLLNRLRPSTTEEEPLNKTAQEYEAEINGLITDATKAAHEANYFKSASILKRASVLSKRFHGGQSLEFAGILGKLSAMQASMGNEFEAKMTWEKALFVWEINRAGRVKKVHDVEKTQLPSSIAVSPIKRKKRAGQTSPSGGMKHLLSLEELFAIPHQTMQHADGRILYAKSITMKELEPRTRQALVNRGVRNPNLLRVRDFHSFFLAHPKISADMRKKYFVRWCQRREILIKELREDMEVLVLEKESKTRVRQMEEKVALEKEIRKAKFFGITNVKQSSFVGPKSVLPVPFDAKFRGSAAVALDAMAEAPVYCPACKTAWDFKHTPCRVCKKPIEWNAMQEKAHFKMTQVKLFLERKERLHKARRERENKRFEEQKQWDMRKTKSKTDYKRAMEFFLLAKRRARMGGGHGNDVPIPEILRKKEPTKRELAQRRAPELYKAVKMGDAANVKRLLDDGINPDTRDVNKWTPLHFAAIRGYLKVVDILISAGAEIEPTNTEWKTPLDLARSAGYGEVMQRLRRASSEAAMYEPLSDEELVLFHQLRSGKRPLMNTLVYQGDRGKHVLSAKIADRIFHGRHIHRGGSPLEAADTLAGEWRMLFGVVYNTMMKFENDEEEAKEVMAKLAEAERRLEEKQLLEEAKTGATVEENPDLQVNAAPAGYAFPLLHTFLARERDMRTTFGQLPQGMSSDENLLRALDKMTKPEVKDGRRRRLNPIATRLKKQKKVMLRKMYLHDLNHAKPPPKKINTITPDDWQTPAIKKLPPPTWVDLENNVFKLKERKIELLMHTLHEAQLDEARQMKKVKAIDDRKYRNEMYQYTIMKNAKRRDEIASLMEDAGILTVPQEINALLANQQMDEMMGKVVL